VEAGSEEEDLFMEVDEVEKPFLPLLALYAIFVSSRMTQNLFHSWIKILHFVFKVDLPILNVRKMFTEVPRFLEDNGVRLFFFFCMV